MEGWLFLPGQIKATRTVRLLSSRPDSLCPPGLRRRVMDTSKTDLALLVEVLNTIAKTHIDIRQEMVFIRDQLREVDLTLQAIVAYND